MNTFKHGDVIEYEVGKDEWRKGVYVAPHPKEDGHHIHLTTAGFVSDRHDTAIRKPKQKKEGWIGLMETKDTHNRWETGVYPTKAALVNITDKMGSRLVSIGKVEWEE